MAFLLAAFFLIGAIGNIFASPHIAGDYLRWGYPNWFHYVTGFLELVTAILLVVKSLRFWGALLGALVMTGATGTVMLHSEFTHAVAPLIVMAVSVVVGWSNKPWDKVLSHS